MRTISPLLPTDDRPTTTKENLTPRGTRNHDKEAVRSAARGQWEYILPQLTGHIAEYFDGDAHPCPKCGDGTDRFQMFDVDAGACRCRQCGKSPADGFGTIEWLCGVSFSEAVNRVGDQLNLTPSSQPPKTIPTKARPPKKPKHEISEADAELRHLVYSTLARCYGLSDAHREALRARGLADADIDANQYFSVSGPKIPAQVSIPLYLAIKGIADTETIRNRVPGVFKVNGEICVFRSSLMIPVRDITGRITAIRCRPDNPPPKGHKYSWLSSNATKSPGLSPGTPAHTPMHSGEPDTLRVTEGEFKAEIATKKTGVRTLSVPGVGCWQSALAAVEYYRPAKLLIAFDSDVATEKDVCRNLAALWESLTTLEWSPEVAVETWPQDYKGLDEALLAGVSIQELTYEQSASHIQSLKAKHGLDQPTLHDLLDDLREHEEPHDPNRLARINIASYESEHGGRLVFWRGSFWRYKSGGWRKIDDDELNAKIRVSINAELAKIAAAEQQVENAKEKPKQIKKRLISNTLVGNVIAELKHLTLLSSRNVEMPCLLSDPQRGRYIVSLQNGLLDLNRVIDGEDPEECFSEHSSDWFSTTMLSYAFDRQAGCPQFLAYLEKSLPDESSRMLIQEFSGYLLVPSNPFQRFFVAEGVAGAGKSVLLSGVWTGLVGKENVSNVKLDGFGGNQFALIDTVGKALNVDPDANQYAKFNEGLFKQFCIGERLQVEGKNGNPVPVTPTAKCVFGWNNRPRIRDASEGLWRRMLLVNFANKVPESERVIGMDTPEWWSRSGELPGILTWALDRLRRLFSQSGFTLSEAMKRSLDEYRRSQNPIESFLDDVVTSDPSNSKAVSTRSIVAAYRHWAQHNTSEADGQAMTARRMNFAIQERFKIESKPCRIGNVSARAFVGIKLTDYIEPEHGGDA